MMRRGIVICVAMLVNGCFASDCFQPKPNGEINWDMMRGRWYQVFNSHDPVDSFAQCFILENIREDADGGSYFELEAVTNLTWSLVTYSAIQGHWLQLQDGKYLNDARYKGIFMNTMESLSKLASDGIRKNGMKESNNFFHEPGTFITDYENYFLILTCTDDGKYIWVHGRNEHATDADMEMVQNKLEQVGNGWDEVPLYLSGCNNLRFPDRDA